MGTQADITGQWLAHEASARSFTVVGGWGTATGVVTPNPPAPRGFLGGGRSGPDRRPVVLVAPQWPGLEDDAAVALVDDALAMGLLDGGVRVARVRSIEFIGEPEVAGWVDAIVDTLQSVSGDAPALGLAGSWLAGSACALAAARREDLAILVFAAAPSAEVMSRRTPENEHDPMWTDSPALRLAEQLAELSPLEAVTVAARPALFVQGAVDTLLPAAHLEAWRAALSATGRASDGVEVAFADAFFRPVDDQGITDVASEEARALLRDAVAAWTGRTLRRGASVRRGR